MGDSIGRKKKDVCLGTMTFIQSFIINNFLLLNYWTVRTAERKKKVITKGELILSRIRMLIVGCF